LKRFAVASDIESQNTIPEEPPMREKDIAQALQAVLVSPNEMDNNMEQANVVDGLFAIARAIDHVARALIALREDRETTRSASEAQ
jgi:hypothetical protein